MNSFHLPSRILSFCHGFWNEDTKEFDSGSSEQVIQCCLDSCNKHIDYCLQNCDDNCDKCQDLIRNCESACLEYDLKVSRDNLNLSKFKKLTQTQSKKKKNNLILLIILIVIILLLLLIIKLKFL